MKKQTKRIISPQTLSFIIMMAACLIVFTILKPSYIQPDNLYTILMNSMLPAVLALSMGIVIAAGGFDLSIGHMAGFSALMCGFFLRDIGTGSRMAMLIAVMLGIILGILNGLMVTKLGISSFIVTLGMQFVLTGVRQWISGGDSYRASKTIKALTQSKVGSVPMLIIVSLLIIIIVGFIIQKTSFGRKIQFVGSNITASEYLGIPVRRYTFIAFVLSGGIAGIVGVLQFSKLTSATINIGDGWLFNSMTIAVFSSVIFGKFKAHGIVLVSILITMITVGINMLGVSASWTNLMLGIILIVSLLCGKYIDFGKLGKKGKGVENGC